MFHERNAKKLLFRVVPATGRWRQVVFSGNNQAVRSDRILQKL